jgi:nucleoid DNA-binding protein
MIREERFDSEDPRGLLLLTYSGSLVVLSPPESDGTRSLEYASIKLRSDVPEFVTAVGVTVAGEIAVDRIAEFSGAPVERTSELLSLASFASDVTATEQNERLRQAAIFLTNGFVRVNTLLTRSDETVPDQFTMREMVRMIASRHEATQTTTRGIIEDYLTTLETGMLLGERVSAGGLGRLSLGLRGPQKARMGRNPSTGEEILIPAKPEQAVPRFKFSRRVRERSAQVPPERIGGGDEDEQE